jgi:hypothetical protein
MPVASVKRFVVVQVRHALQHTAAIGAFSPYFVDTWAMRPCQTALLLTPEGYSTGPRCKHPRTLGLARSGLGRPDVHESAFLRTEDVADALGVGLNGQWSA